MDNEWLECVVETWTVQIRSILKIVSIGANAPGCVARW